MCRSLLAVLGGPDGIGHWHRERIEATAVGVALVRPDPEPESGEGSPADPRAEAAGARGKPPISCMPTQ